MEYGLEGAFTLMSLEEAVETFDFFNGEFPDSKIKFFQLRRRRRWPRHAGELVVASLDPDPCRTVVVTISAPTLILRKANSRPDRGLLSRREFPLRREQRHRCPDGEDGSTNSLRQMPG